MATNDFLTIAGGGGAFVETQATFAADSSVLANGFPAGILTKEKLNKAIRQSSIMSAVLAQFIADISGANSVDDGTTATLLANLKKSTQSTVAGSILNLLMSVTAASASATLTADEIILETALGGSVKKLSSFNKTINLATTGAGGMDTGTAPVSGFVGLYAIYNPTTDTAALLAVNASTSKPAIYGGANMPSGYTFSALISVWPTNGSGQFVVGLQVDKKIGLLSAIAADHVVIAGTYTSISISALVPANAKSINGTMQVEALSSGATGNLNTYYASDANGTNEKTCGIAKASASGFATSSPYDLILTNQTIYYKLISAGITGTTTTLTISGYSI